MCFSSDTKKYKHESEAIRHYLLKLEISAELAGPDLYNQYINKVGTGQTMNSDEVNFTTDKVYDDYQLEVILFTYLYLLYDIVHLPIFLI